MARAKLGSQAIIAGPRVRRERQPAADRRAGRGVRLILFLCVAAFWSSACRRPPAGVLTLAPAGMHTTGACTAAADGTLTMARGATADSTIYVDAGAVTITVTAAPSSVDDHPQLELWLAGERIGAVALESTEAQAVRFSAQARTSSPTALHLAYVTEAGQSDRPAPALHVEKVVITQP